MVLARFNFSCNLIGNRPQSPTISYRQTVDKMKFPLLIAFHICFKISTKKKGMSSLELSEEFGLRQKTVWEFKWKIQQAMASSRKHQLGGKVQIDEFLIGEYEEGKVGRAYAQVIARASSKDFRPFFETYFSKEAHVITDVWKGSLPLKKDYLNLEQIPSKKERVCNNYTST
jgi:hypothetical protein